MKSRALAVAILLLVCAHSHSATPAGPATTAYYRQLETIIVQRATKKLATKFDLLQGFGAVTLTYRVRADGTVQRVMILSGPRRGFVVETFVETIRSMRFPPIPKVVLKELGTEYADPEATLQFGPPRR
jgi:hypothetical protein